jgi:HlyD family secretion protein
MVDKWSRSGLVARVQPLGVLAGLVLGLLVGGAACRRADVTEGRYQGMIAFDQRELAFETAGRLTEVTVRRGQRLVAGAVVARQDEVVDRQARAVDVRAVELAEADLAVVRSGSRAEDVRAAEAKLGASKAAEKNAQLELARDRTLVARGAIGAAGLDLLEAQLAATTGARQADEERLRALRRGARTEEVARATARVTQAQEALVLDDRRLERRTLVAPVGGVVEDVFLEPGEVAGAGVPIAAVVDASHPYADVFVPVPEAPRVRVGAVAHLRIEGAPGDGGELAGVVELIYPDAEFTPRYVFSPRERPNLMLRVRVRLTGEDLHAGLPVFATFDAATATTADAKVAP